MPLAFLAALAGSLTIHLAALFGTDYELFGEDKAPPPPLLVEIQPLPVAKQAPPAAKPRAHPATSKPRLAVPQTQKTAAADVPAPVPENAPSEASTVKTPLEAPVQASAPPKPVLPTQGVIRYQVFMGEQGLIVGRAEHRWEFLADGRYRLQGLTETSGLVSLFKSLRFENESSGHLAATGLVPESYRTLKNGSDGKENADFDWTSAVVHLARDGSTREIAQGTQDILSLNYQLAYLGTPEKGAHIGVVTGKKYENYALDALGEEDLETPAGRFRTLHLRAMTDSVTEIWIALDRYRLPVKIRFTDKKGGVFEQLATEIGTLAEPKP